MSYLRWRELRKTRAREEMRLAQEKELPHAGQIITTRRTIIRFLWDIELSVTDNTIWLIANGVNGSDGKLRLYATCARLYYLSRLVYKGKDGIRKLDTKRYRKELFEGSAETKEEVKHVMMERRKQGEKSVSNISDDAVERTYRCLNCIAELWCRNIACLYEQIYIPEMAYEFDYVLKHDGNLPKPE